MNFIGNQVCKWIIEEAYSAIWKDVSLPTVQKAFINIVAPRSPRTVHSDIKNHIQHLILSNMTKDCCKHGWYQAVRKTQRDCLPCRMKWFAKRELRLRQDGWWQDGFE